MKKQQSKKNNHTKIQIFEIFSMATLFVALGFAIFGMSKTVSDIDKAAIAKTPDAILASAGVSEDENVFLSVAYFDQKADECIDLYDDNSWKAAEGRQFEWTECGYYNKGLEQGMVSYQLNDEYLPVAKGGNLTSNRGLKDMNRWFNAVDGKSASYTGNLKLDYRSDIAEFSFYKDEFYPLDEVEFSNGDAANKDGHNHLFTMNFAVPFTALLSGQERFEIVADDDTFVYVGDKLAIDLGGIHSEMPGRFSINEKGEVYAGVGLQDMAYTGITVDANSGSIVRIFHADRDSEDSVFKIRFTGMNLSVTDAKLADREDEGLQIAYDPTDPTYVAPLGETSVVKPDNTKGFILLVTVEGIMVLVFAVLLAFSIRSMVRRKVAEAQNK